MKRRGLGPAAAGPEDGCGGRWGARLSPPLRLAATVAELCVTLWEVGVGMWGQESA